MNPEIAHRLTQLGIELPSLPPPRFQYVPATIVHQRLAAETS